ncbi:MAG: sulfate respiration complex protein HmcD [Desulfobaccales bacterium]
MEHQFYTLFDFLVYTKFAAYILMGLTLLGFLGFWLFLTGRDEDKEIH